MGIDGLHVGSQTKARLLFDQGVELAFKKMLVRRFFAANNHVDQFFLRVGQSFVVKQKQVAPNCVPIKDRGRSRYSKSSMRSTIAMPIRSESCSINRWSSLDFKFLF